jgi:hypothetical protein
MTEGTGAQEISALIEKLRTITPKSPIMELEKISEEIQETAHTFNQEEKARLRTAYKEACTRDWEEVPRWVAATFRVLEGRARDIGQIHGTI